MNNSENPPHRQSPEELLAYVISALSLLSETKKLETLEEIDDAVTYLKACEQRVLEQIEADETNDALFRIRSFIGMLEELKTQQQANN